MNKKLLQLRKMILSLGETETDKAVLIYEGELTVGVEVFIEDESGDFKPAEDGQYKSAEQIITVSDGKVTQIEDIEVADQQEDVETKEELDKEEEARIAELEAELAMKQAELETKDARIAELEAELEELKAKLEESDGRPADEDLKLSKQKRSKTGITFDLYK